MSRTADGEGSRILRSIVIALVVLLAVSVVGGSAVLAAVRDLPERTMEVVRGSEQRGQSAAQISPREFVRVRRGETKERVRALLGEPETTARATVEGVAVECWLYGISGTTGAFQLCFADGRLSSRFRYR